MAIHSNVYMYSNQSLQHSSDELAIHCNASRDVTQQNLKPALMVIPM